MFTKYIKRGTNGDTDPDAKRPCPPVDYSDIMNASDTIKKDLLKPNYNAEKRRRELDKKKKKEEKELKKKLRKEAIARGEDPDAVAPEEDDDEEDGESAEPTPTA